MFQHGSHGIFGQGMSGGREWHAPLLVNGRITKANFAGPGTEVFARLRKGDKPKSGADKAALRHDLEYGLAQGDPVLERKADERMVAKLKDKKSDNWLNRNIGSLPIKAKMALENVGLFPKGKMSKGPPLTEEEKQLTQTTLNDLDLEGWGKPGARLRQIARQKGCGNFPSPPPDLPMAVPPAVVEEIRQVAIKLGVPERLNEWVNKQNHFMWLQHNGVATEPALQEVWGEERPFLGIINQGVGRDVQRDMSTGPSRIDMQDAMAMDQPRRQQKRRRSTVSKAEFLERMAKGRAAARRKRGRTTKRRLTAPRRKKMTAKVRAMLKRYGRGLVLAGAGSPDDFDIPEDMSTDEIPGHIGGALQKYFNVTAPPKFMASLGEVMNGSGKEDLWDSLEEQLSGVKQV